MQSTRDTNVGIQQPTASPAPRRYAGRAPARSGEKAHQSGQLEVAALLPRPWKRNRAKGSTPLRVRPAVVPWSLRLALMLSLVCVVLVLFRSFGLFTPPVGSPTGVEATYG